MEQYLIDTNIVSDYFSDSLPDSAILLLDSIINATPNLSVITQIELLCWNTNITTEENVRDFISDSKILDISPAVIAQCVILRKSNKIKTPDAIIAATALAHNFTLITNNEKNFKKINGLKLFNPHKDTVS